MRERPPFQPPYPELLAPAAPVPNMQPPVAPPEPGSIHTALRESKDIAASQPYDFTSGGTALSVITGAGVGAGLGEGTLQVTQHKAMKQRGELGHKIETLQQLRQTAHTASEVQTLTAQKASLDNMAHEYVSVPATVGTLLAVGMIATGFINAKRQGRPIRYSLFFTSK